MKLLSRLALVAALAGLVFVAVTQRHGRVDTARVSSARGALAELHARELALRHDKDRLLGNQLRNVDPVADDVRALKVALAQLEALRNAAWLEAGERALVAKSLDECRAALRAQESSVEVLKTYIAWARNSIDNFPGFAEALDKSAPRALQGDVRQLRLLVAEFLGGRDADAASIEQLTDRLRKAGKGDKGPVGDQLQWVAGHADAIVQARRTIARQKAALEQPQAEQAIALLDATVTRTLDAAVVRSARGRMLLIGLAAAVLVLGLAQLAVRKRGRA
jgi:DAHL domain-containing protein